MFTDRGFQKKKKLNFQAVLLARTSCGVQTDKVEICGIEEYFSSARICEIGGCMTWLDSLATLQRWPYRHLSSSAPDAWSDPGASSADSTLTCRHLVSDLFPVFKLSQSRGVGCYACRLQVWRNEPTKGAMSFGPSLHDNDPERTNKQYIPRRHRLHPRSIPNVKPVLNPPI